MLEPKCDTCGSVMESMPEHLFSAQWGGLAVDVKVGVHHLGKGEVCPTCVKKALATIVEHGIFVGRKITIPSNIAPLIPAVEEHKSWSLR